MIELHARVICERCNQTILDLENVDDVAEAEQRLTESTDWGCLDEDGNEVCAACWATYDHKQIGVA